MSYRQSRLESGRCQSCNRSRAVVSTFQDGKKVHEKKSVYCWEHTKKQAEYRKKYRLADVAEKR